MPAPPAQAAPAAPAAPIRRPPGAPGAGQSTEAALRRPPMRPAIVNKRLPQPPGARREVPKRRSDKIDVGRAVEGENDFRSRSAAQHAPPPGARAPPRARQRAAAEGLSRGHDSRDHHGPGAGRSACPSAAPTSIKTLMRMGVMATINQAIDPDTAELVVTEMGHRLKRVAEGDVETGLAEAADADRVAAAAAAGGHHHGPRRPRQDLAARRAARHRRGGARGGRHHPAYRRLPGDPAVGARRSPSSTRRATRPSPPCAPAAPR